MSSSSKQQNETDYHIQHFCDGIERFVNVGPLTDLLNKLVHPVLGISTVQDMERNYNLPGVCNFYMKAVDESLLNYFPLEKGSFVHRYHTLYFERIYRFRKSLLPTEEMDVIEIGPLYPIRTDGDGNCLLHAVSICMWGCHDPVSTIHHQMPHGYHVHRYMLCSYIAQHCKILLLHYKAAG